MLKPVLIAGALLIAAVVAWESAHLGIHLWRARALAAASTPFERTLPRPRHRLLVVGDSTAVGTGASDPAASVAGRLAAAFPGLAVENRARDGAVTRAVVGQLAGVQEHRFDLVLVQTGGNDILRLTPTEGLREATAAVLDAAGARGRRVVMMSTGDVGTAPAFPFPVDRLLSARTRQVRQVFMEAAAAAGVTYVDLYRRPAADPFLADPDRYYARDGLHPSGAGYALWYRELMTQAPVARILGDTGGS